MRPLSGVLAAVILAVVCSSAGATVYCVPTLTSSCTDSRPTLADAITAANAAPDSDTILLAAGAYTGGVTASYETHIVGASQTSSRIDGGSGTYGVRLMNASSSIQDLTIHEPSGGPKIGLYLSGDAQRVTVDMRDNPVTGFPAVSLHDDGSFVDGSALNALASGADEGLSISGNGDPLISDVQVQGDYAITTSGSGFKRLRFIKALADVYGLQAQAETTLFEDSAVIGGRVSSYTGAGASADAATTVRHVTVKGSYIGAEASAMTATIDVSNSAVVGNDGDPETADLYVLAGPGATGVLNVGYSFFRDAHALTGNAGGTETITRGTGNIGGADAGLLSIGEGDLRPAWNSPLVDKGDPVPGGGEPMADLAGGDRTVNGVTDIGAYEYGRHAPTITATGSSASVLTGESVTFNATVSDADPKESSQVSWSFGDGTTADGAGVVHAFSAPGSYLVRATATDPAGLTSSTTTSVTVTAPFLPRAVLPPALGFTKLKAVKGFVRVRLSCPVVAADCKGVVRLVLAGTKTELGRASYRLPNGTSKAIRVHLTKSARKRLRRARHGLRVKVIAKPAGGATKSKTVRLTGR